MDAAVWNVGWTEEDQEIWRTRKMSANTIYMRYQHHKKEADLMVSLSKVDMPPGEAKLTFLALMGELK